MTPEAPTEGISCFVNYHVSHVMRKIPSYLKDTPNFMLQLEEFTDLPLETLLVRQPPTDSLTGEMEMILTKNNFTFADQNYLQMHGMAVGTWMAPSYAHLFMGHPESYMHMMALSYANLFMGHPESYMYMYIQEGVDKKPAVWLRFTDDAIMILPHSKGCLNEFLRMIKCTPHNKIHCRAVE